MLVDKAVSSSADRQTSCLPILSARMPSLRYILARLRLAVGMLASASRAF